MQSDLVSVIIPVYNAQKYIVECIDSVLTQTHTNLEVIIVNDGSTDHTLHLINHYKDERILIVNQENKGCSNAKNTGLLHSNGAFIQYLDADDILSTAARSIAEIITIHQDVNVDFEDVKTVMKDAGAAVMGSATEEGEGRAIRAAGHAISSPLLNNPFT